MKRILINATHNEEIRVALCKDNHLYDFDLENRTREQKKANIYKGRITRIEPSLEAAFIEYGSAKQGFLPLREIAPEYLKGQRDDNIRKLIKEGDELIIQIAKEERGNKGAAVSTFISLAGRYLVLMPNNTKGGGISRQISGKVRDEMRAVMAKLEVPKGMSVILRTAGIGKGFEELSQDLAHLLSNWATILQSNATHPAPFLLYQEAGVVTRAMRDYLRDDIGEIWIDSQDAYNEAASFITSVMPTQMSKLRKYTAYEPLFVHFGIERQIESAYQREVRLPSGGSIVIDQTEALVSIDINSAKSTKGSDVAETAYHTNLEAADEIARQLRLRDMGGLIVIDFIDMAESSHQKAVEKRLIDATRFDRARVQFAEISRFGLLEMSRQRLRPSLEEATGYICPRCHGNGMIRDIRSLALSIMREIEQLALRHRSGEVQAEVPTEIAAFLLNEKRESLVYLEQDSDTRITILPHAHLESPNFSVHFNPDGFAPATYERITDVEGEQEEGRGYEVNWQTKPTHDKSTTNHWDKQVAQQKSERAPATKNTSAPKTEPTTNQAVAWLSNLFAPKTQATLAHSLDSRDAAAAIEEIVNSGASSLGASGHITNLVNSTVATNKPNTTASASDHKAQAPKHKKPYDKPKGNKEPNKETHKEPSSIKPTSDDTNKSYPKREPNSQRDPRETVVRAATTVKTPKDTVKDDVKDIAKDKHPSEKKTPTNKTTASTANVSDNAPVAPTKAENKKGKSAELSVHIERLPSTSAPAQTIHLTLDGTPAIDTPKGTSLEVRQIRTEDSKSTVTATEVVNVDTPIPSATPAPQSPKSQDTDTANKRASNDPRSVAAAQATQQATPTTISGTAGAFIRQTLGGFAPQGFIASFIQAVATVRASRQDTPKVDFANYGYAPLSAEYLSNFAYLTAATGQFSTAQGKTEATPTPPNTRASNDPRGQATSDKTKPSAVQSPSESNSSESNNAKQAPTNMTATANKQASDANLALAPTSAETEMESKTTPTDYKHMIENVAEQMLPKTHVLKLATPKPKKTAAKKPTKVAIKIPKADTKPKTEIRKRKVQADTKPVPITPSEE